MNLKYDSYLYSELIYIYKKTKNKEVKNELYDRMNFCGFDKKMIECFIELEKFIIDYQNINYDKPLYDKYYWLKDQKTLFANYINDIFMINCDKVTKQTLTFSECLCLLDEATYIMTLYNNIDNNLKKEISIFCECNNNNFVRKEITYRFMLCYDKLKIDESEMPIEYFDMINKFINNELRIINLCKWIYPNDKQNGIKKQWKPYTREYYDYYN